MTVIPINLRRIVFFILKKSLLLQDIKNLKPATDFYKSLALTCSGHQIAIDLFLLNSQYADLATLSGMSRFCAGSVQTFPNIAPDSAESERLEKDFTRYLTRKIGFEAVLRVRCTKGMEHFFFEWFPGSQLVNKKTNF